MNTTTLSGERSVRSAASFRDPSGYVFRRAGRVMRAIDAQSYNVLEPLLRSGELGKRLTSGSIVKTKLLEQPAPDLLAEHPGFSHFLEHEKIELISYPYEWSFSMLADAALLTLELQEALVRQGLALKDATPFNIQFVEGRPVFIDLTSIERPARMDLWFALGQFQRTFLFPLLLMRYAGWDLRSYFTTALDGRSPGDVARILGPLRKWQPRYLMDVTLPLALEQESANVQQRKTSDEAVPAKAAANPEALLLNLKRLTSKIVSLKKSRKGSSLWFGYKAICTYDQVAEASKKELIASFLRQARPAKVLDVGCNTGDYSFLAAESGAEVISIDADHDAVDALYKRAAGRAIHPLVIDISNPTPATGYLNQERPSFLERVQVDCVLALAVIHHLLVSGNLSLKQIVELFSRFTSRNLILEFVPREDPMFQRLIRHRVDLYQAFTIEECLRVFSEEFRLVQTQPIANSPRTLLFFERRSGSVHA